MRTVTTTRPLRELIQDFSKGKIQLPQFQRDYVWKPKKIRNLLDSLFRGFPIGGFYLWRPTGAAIDPKQKRFGEIRIGDEFTGYLIDGQQRLTSLEAAFALYSGEDKGGEALRCYLDLSASDDDRGRDTRIFVSYGGHRAITKRVDEGDSTLIEVSSFLNGQDPDLREQAKDALRARRGWTPKRVDDAIRRFDRAGGMLDQPVPCTTVHDVSDKEAVEVFSRLNKGGTPLRQGDVRAAELARGTAVSVLKEMREFVTAERPQRLGFGFSFAFRALVVFHRESAQFASLKPEWMDTAGPHGRTLKHSWDATQKGLATALEFIDEEMGWSRRILVPSANAIIVLAAAMDSAKFKRTEDDTQLYRRWLCLIALRGVFQGSVETTINRFIRSLAPGRRPARALVDSLRGGEGKHIEGEELLRPSQLWGPATQILHAWLVNREAVDWLSDEPIDGLARVDRELLPGGDLTVHHIFARENLKGVVENADEANVPANFALISRATNSQFGKKPADQVLASLTPDERIRAEVQFFGEDAGDRLRSDRFEEFCKWRADRLADTFNQFLGIDRRQRRK